MMETLSDNEWTQIIMESDNFRFQKGDILLDSSGRRMRVARHEPGHTVIVQFGWKAWLQYWWNWLVARPVAATLCGEVNDA
ncbi:MAG: hypothetical protein KAJ19_18545 [Gammaproteobacteria bacterium]|nr:hypothetical protein [Gammaproteobacteria bacterium]